MIVGPSGSGKTSLACAGVLPALIQGLDGSEISWRFATVMPSSGGTAGSPFAGLATAILKKTAVPELAQSAYKGNWQSLENDLCHDPKRAIFRLSQTLQLLSFANSLESKKDRLLLANHGAESEDKQVHGPAKSVRLMLIVDQLEQLFTGGFSFDLQRRYLHLISDLARSLQVYVVATLQSEFLDAFHEHLTAGQSIFLSGIYELHAPSQPELTEILHLSAKEAGVCFESDPATGRGLDLEIADSIVGRPERMPELGLLLSELYLRQCSRNDGELIWSDYNSLGCFDGVLAKRAEIILNSLEERSREYFGPVLARLLTAGADGQLSRRTVAYRDLIATPGNDSKRQITFKKIVDRLLEEDLLCSENDPNNERIVWLTQEAIVGHLPRSRQILSPEFFRTRRRIEPSLSAWASGGRKNKGLLASSALLRDANDLVRKHRNSVTSLEREFLLRSLKKQKNRRLWIGFTILLALAAVGWTLRNDNKTVLSDLQKFRIMDVVSRAVHFKPPFSSGGTETTDSKRQDNGASQEIANREQAASPTQSGRTQGSTAAVNDHSPQSNLTRVERPSDTAHDRNVAAVGGRPASEQNADSGSRKVEELSKRVDLMEAELNQAKQDLEKAKRSAAEAVNQRDELQAKIELLQKNADSTHRDADRLSTERDSLRDQLAGSEQQIQKLQKELSGVNSERNLLRAQLPPAEPSVQRERPEAAIGTPVTHANELIPVTARDSADQVATPSSAQSQMTPGGSENPAPSANEISEEGALKNFVLGYLNSVSDQDPAVQAHFFSSDGVSISGRGNLSLPQARRMIEQYREQWPVREWKPNGDLKIVKSSVSGSYLLVQPFSWSTSNGPHVEHGSGLLYIRVHADPDGGFKIVKLHQMAADSKTANNSAIGSQATSQAN